MKKTKIFLAVGVFIAVILVVVLGRIMLNQKFNGNQQAAANSAIVTSSDGRILSKEMQVGLLGVDAEYGVNSGVSLIPGKGYIEEPELSSESLGVMVVLKDDPLGKNYEQLHKNGLSKADIKSKIALKAQDIRSKHEALKSFIKQKTKKNLIGPGQKQNGALRIQEYKNALNAISFRDISYEEAKTLFAGRTDIASISRNKLVSIDLNDSVPQMDVPDVWKLYGPVGVPLDGTGTTIGIIDSGVQYTHPDLGGCYGNNNPLSTCKVVGGYDFVNHDNDPTDDNGHGTHVAATAAGNGTLITDTGTIPLPGVAPGAKIYAYKVMNNRGSGGSDDIIAGIERCTDPNQDGDLSDHLDVCSMSLGSSSGDPDDDMSIAVDNASAVGTVFTIAAGNSGPGAQTIGSPGTSRSAITVAASCKTAQIGKDGQCTTPIANFSSRGPVKWTDAGGIDQTLMKPDIAAVGHMICAAKASFVVGGSPCGPDHFAISGTSMATPHVAGAAAIVREAHPEFSAAEIKKALMDHARDLGLPGTVQGAGEVDLAGTINAISISTNEVDIQGSPVTFADPTTSLTQTFTKNVSLKNKTNAPVTATFSLVNNQAGYDMVLNDTNGKAISSAVLPANATVSFTVSVTVHHDVARTANIFSGLVKISTGPATNQKLQFSVVVTSDHRISSTITSFNYDLVAPSGDTKNESFTITNKLIDAPVTLTAKVRCCTSGSGVMTDLGGTINSQASYSFTLAKGEQKTLAMKLAIPSSLMNTNYTGYIDITSSLENFSIPITFFKGYKISIDFDAVRPTVINMKNELTGGSMAIWLPGNSQTNLYFGTNGPYDVMALWNDTTLNKWDTIVVRDSIDPAVTPRISLKKSDAVYEQKFDFRDRYNNAVVGNYMGSVLTASKGTKGFSFWASTSLSSLWTNAMPDTYTIEYAAFKNNPATVFGAAIKGVTASKTFTNSPNDLKKFIAKSFDPNIPNFSFEVGAQMVGPVSPASTRYNIWADSLLGSFTTSDRYFGINGMGQFDVYMAQQSDPEITGTLEYPIFDILGQNKDGVIVYKTPAYTLAPSGVLRGLSTGHTFRSSLYNGLYQNIKTPSTSYFIPIAQGPMIDTSVWGVNANNSGGMISALPETNSLYVNQGRGNDFWGYYNSPSFHDYSIPYTISIDGKLTKTGNIPYNTSTGYYPSLTLDQSTDPIPKTQSGLYSVTTTHNYQTQGIPLTAKTTVTFTVSATPHDANPPRLIDLQIRGGGYTQEVIDSNLANTLAFSLDHVAGVTGWPEETVLTGGSLASVSASYKSHTDSNWTNLSIAQTSGEYTAPISVISGAALYDFKIFAKDQDGNTYTYEFSVPSGSGVSLPSATDDTTPPSAPANVLVTTTGTTATITWDPSTDTGGSGLAGYNVFKKNPDTSRTNLNTTPVTGTSYTVTGLTPSKAYVMGVESIDKAGNVSQEVVFFAITTSDTTAPSVPTNLVSSSKTTSSVSLSWSASTDDVGVTGYEVFKNGQSVGTTTTTSFTASNLLAGTQYSFTVRARDAVGNYSAQSSALLVTTNNAADTTPPVISAISASSITSSGAVVKFTTDESANTEIYYGTVSSTYPFSLVDNSMAISHNITLSGLSANTKYYYIVKSKDGVGNPSTSSENSFTTLTASDTTLPIVTAFTIPATNGSLVVPITTFTASDNIGVTGYLVNESSTKPTIGASGWSTTKQTSYTFVSAGTKTIYAWVKDAAGNISASRSASVTISITTNIPPSITPLSSVTLSLPTHTLALSPVVSDDNYNGSKVTATWSGTNVVFTPITTTGTAPITAATTATFPSTAGSYPITLTATDGTLVTTVTMMVTIATAGTCASPFSDNFNTTTLNSCWSKVSGGWSILNNQLTNGATATTQLITIPTIVGSTQSVTVTITPTNTQATKMGVVLRQQAGNYYICDKEYGGSAIYRISKVTNNTAPVSLATIASNNTLGSYTFTCSISGSTITITTPVGTKTITDTSFTTGATGLYYAGPAVAQKYDDVSVSVQ